MSSALLIAFDEADVCQGAGFAQALGIPFCILALTTMADTDFGAVEVRCASLDSIPPADGLAKALVPVCEPYSHIIAVSSMRSKDLLARLAALLDAAMATDVVGIVSTTSFLRPIVAGSVIATVERVSGPIVLTFRAASFPAPHVGALVGPTPIALLAESEVKVRSVVSRGGDRPDLTQAKVVVTGGRPLRDAETYERLIGGLADALGGATGATRAAVDSGIAPNEMQVGQTGKIVAPALYIAAGVSGSTQHMAGIKDSKLIVAINTDPDAPIFETADIGMVADLFVAIPEILNRI